MKKQHIDLSDEDRDFLIALLRKGKLSARKMKRAQGMLELARGKTYRAVSDQLNCSYVTVQNWAKKYRSGGLGFLDDRPRPGRPTGLSGPDRAKVTALACSEPPKGHARWSLRLLADKLVELEIVDSISFKQVGNILKKTNYSPTGNANGASQR